MTEKQRRDGDQRRVESDDRVHRKLSRRSLLTNSAAVGVGALALSVSGTARATARQDGGCGLQEPGRADELAPEVQEFLEAFAENAKPIHTLSTDQARQAYQNLFVEDVSPEEAGNTVGNVENREIPGPDDNQIPIRIYTPKEGEGPYPVTVYFHGGGWVLGDLDTHDSVARSLTNSSGAMVVSVDYRLAPENPFPAAVRDAFAATRWVLENADEIGVDPDRVAIGGESAGGNLSTVTALQMQGTDLPSLAHQLLVYPVGTLSRPFLFPDERGVENPYLVPEDAAWFGERYLPYPEAAMNAYASPLYYANDLSDLPSATVMATGIGLWRDQSFAYAKRLCDAGVDVDFQNYPALLHDVMNMEVLPDPFPDVPQASRLFEDAGTALQDAFGQ
jgi:acetyl esterase